MSMKILLLITGQIREDYVKTYESLNDEILSKYDCDIYMSVWDNDPNLNECIKLYNPKKVKIDIFNNVKEDIQYQSNNYHLVTPETNVENVLYMWYKIKNCFDLIDDNSKYDVILKTRFDLQIKDLIDLKTLDKNYLYVPFGWDHRQGVNDLMSFGSYDIMKKYCSTYDMIYSHYLSGCYFHPETLLKYHIEKLNIGLKRPLIKHYLRGQECHNG